MGAHLHESDRTLRDGSLGGAFPGTSCQATIGASLRDEVKTGFQMSKLQGPKGQDSIAQALAWVSRFIARGPEGAR